MGHHGDGNTGCRQLVRIDRIMVCWTVLRGDLIFYFGFMNEGEESSPVPTLKVLSFDGVMRSMHSEVLKQGGI